MIFGIGPRLGSMLAVGIAVLGGAALLPGERNAIEGQSQAAAPPQVVAPSQDEVASPGPGALASAAVVTRPTAVPRAQAASPAGRDEPGLTPTPHDSRGDTPSRTQPEPVVIASVPSAESSATARVAGTGVSVRSGPSNDAGRLFALAAGEHIIVLGADHGWLHVRSDDGREGWVYSSFVVNTEGALITASNGHAEQVQPSPGEGRESSAANPPAKKAPKQAGYIHLSSNVALKAGPSSGAPEIFVLGAGATVAVVESRGAWIRVKTPEGPSGWMRAH